MTEATDKKQGAVRKRQQIKESSKSMFLWVAGMSVVVGFALVISWFLWQQIAFQTKVVGEKNKTVDTLKQNIDAAKELRDNMRVLETNTALNDAKANREDKALQVILDALPSDANSLALGASLQQVLSRGVSGLRVESITVTPAASEKQTQSKSRSKSANKNTLSFRMVVSSSNINAHRQLLERFERSIRVIDIDSLRFERSSDAYTMTIDAHAYYEPAVQVELTEKAV